MVPDISHVRLHTQHIAKPKFKTPAAVVAYFGAMQAQDYAMAKWAVGARMAESTDALVEKALDEGKIIRTHLMRPTWHFVAAEDFHWLLELTAPNILRLMKSNDKLLGLDEATFAKSNSQIRKALETEKHMTREELVAVLQHSGIRTNEYRSGHLLGNAELQGIICSGKRKGNKQTYTLVENWVKKEKQSVYLLPAFDEFLIAYKDRSASILKDFSKHAFTNNGIFKPVIVVNGQVIGTWKRTAKKDKLIIETNLLQKTAKSLHPAIEKEALRYGDFMEKKVEVII